MMPPSLSTRIANAPVLTAEHEWELGLRAQEGDRKAVDDLVMSHMRIIPGIVIKMRLKERDEDLFQEGCIALQRAAERFVPSTNNRFTAFAMAWVTRALADYVRLNAHTIRKFTTKPLQKLYNGRHDILKMVGKERYVSLSSSDIAYVAERFNVPEQAVRDFISRVDGSSISLDAAAFMEEELVGDCGIDDQLIARERTAVMENLDKVVSTLSEREADVVFQRRLADAQQKATLTSLAQKYGISPERVRQIEACAMAKLSNLMDPSSDGQPRWTSWRKIKHERQLAQRN